MRPMKRVPSKKNITACSALSPAPFALSLDVWAAWHIWIHPSHSQHTPKIIWPQTAELRSTLRAAASCVEISPWNLTAVMTKFSYSEYLSEFRNAGGHYNNVQSRLRGDRTTEARQGDATSEPAWVTCCCLGCVRARACIYLIEQLIIIRVK